VVHDAKRGVRVEVDAVLEVTQLEARDARVGRMQADADAGAGGDVQRVRIDVAR
jgi:hypothetical protein